MNELILNIVLISISFIIFTGYVSYIWVNYGIQQSISASYYNLKERTPKYKWIFTAVLIGFSIPVMIVGDSVWMFLAGSMICFTSASPHFMGRKQENLVHMISASVGILLGILGIVLGYNLWQILPVIIPVALLIYSFTKDYIWWLEVLAFYSILTGILIEKIILWRHYIIPLNIKHNLEKVITMI